MSEYKIVNRGNTIEFYDPKKVEKYLLRYVPEGTDVKDIVGAINEYVELEEEVTSLKIQEELYSIVEGLISAQDGKWQNVAGAIKSDIFRKEVFNNRGFDSGLLKMFELAHEHNQYTDFYLKYSVKELAELTNYVNYSRDYLLNHVGAHIAYSRYTTSIPNVVRVHGREVVKGTKIVETLQERYMAIALFLLQDEKRKQRLDLVKEAYDHMSLNNFTPATPTFMNSGRPDGNLSSCFVGMVDDSIHGIYDDAKQFASISKNAGGYGLYFGNVRSIGSSIKGKPGLSSGSIPFMKLFDVTASSVDQQGARRGAVTITLDAWHRDVGEFLKAPLNNTILEKQMHNIFLAVAVPDIFFRKLQNNEPWFQFDPKEVQDVMGYSLQDYYDETKDGGSFSTKYEECVQAYKDGYLQLVSETSPLALLAQINKTRQEKGHPFLFFRDTVNRDNANEGMIYCSNLCTEITISMSLPEIKTEIKIIDGEEVIVQSTKAGDIPTCNLSSINLSKIAKAQLNGEDWRTLVKEIVEIQYRLLANVIRLNNHNEMPQTKISSMRRREVGLGQMGLAHALALKHIVIDTDEAIAWEKEVSEEIAFNIIQASSDYAVEKDDIAPAFHSSKWADGSYIESKFIPHVDNRNRWELLKDKVIVQGMYSTTLMATAPTETISYIANTTAGNDPVFNKEYTLEKAGIKTNMVVPDIDASNFFFYKDAFSVNKSKFLESVGVRQQFIDQSISTNLYYIKDNLKALEMVQHYIDAWKNGVKTIYYHRSESQAAYELACESCSG